MAYNLQSLITILHQILNPAQEHWILDDHSKPQLESLLEKAVSLKQILENSSIPKPESLEIQIRDAAHKAEDLIESHMADQMLSQEGTRFTFVTPDLQEVTQELDSAMEQVVKLVEEHNISSTVSSSIDDPLSGDASSSADPTVENVVVGFESIPNIENLGLYLGQLASSTEVVDLTHLHELQTLRCISELNEDSGCRFLLQKLRFPSRLRKLDLIHCVIYGRFMTTLCALPDLEVLQIGECVFDDNEEWEAAEGDEFRSLQFLKFQDLKLVRWRADETNFPRLRELVIRNCHDLEAIPGGIGEIPTLQLIDLYKCSPSAVTSAKRIQELQQSEFDNYDLKLQIYD